jgi:hypothetical protein
MMITVTIERERASEEKKKNQMASLKFHPHLPSSSSTSLIIFSAPSPLLIIEHSCMHFCLIRDYALRLVITHAENEQFFFVFYDVARR